MVGSSVRAWGGHAVPGGCGGQDALRPGRSSGVRGAWLPRFVVVVRRGRPAFLSATTDRAAGGIILAMQPATEDWGRHAVISQTDANVGAYETKLRFYLRTNSRLLA